MKKTMTYQVNGKTVERVVNYIPVRYIFAFLFTILEVLAIIGAVVALCYFVPYFYLAAYATEIVCIIKIIASNDNPEYKIPWLVFVLILPIVGFMLYFIFYSRKLQKKFIRRLDQIKADAYRRDDGAEFALLAREDKAVASNARMLCRISGSYLFKGTKTTYFPLGEELYRAMLEDLRRAEHFIFMEYFIIEEGVFWNSILEILKEKAANGVEIRVLYDDIGCMSTLPGDYARQLRRMGINALPFSRLRGNADSEFNNRSHRKITVIDGRIGYTGGVNIADEYINQVERFGHWKDTGLRLEGEAVHQLTNLFLGDFAMNVKIFTPAKPAYYPALPTTEGEGFSIPFGDGPRPIYDRRVGKTVIQSMLSCAMEYAWITTPYLIIDNDLCLSLENAALRGVDVRLILPHIPDKKLVFAMSRSFYPRLMAAGVKIYEYKPGFIHAKSYLVDGKQAMVGTINLDYRSLVHHFENGVFLYRSPSICDLKRDFEETLEKSILVEEKSIKGGILRRALCAVVRIFAPLL